MRSRKIGKQIISTLVALVISVTSLSFNPNLTIEAEAAGNTIETTYDVSKTFTGLDHTHLWSFYYDDDYHWQQCDICGKINNKHAHVLTENGGSKEYCMDSGDKAFRYVCTCGYSTKPLQVVHGRWYNYKNTDSYSRASQIYLKNIMQITKKEFNEWYGGKTHDGFEYTWYDYDGDGYGHVFCGGLVINRTKTQKGEYDSWGQQGTIAYIVGAEGDCGKYNPTDEYLSLSMYLYYECSNDIDKCTRSGFVQYLKDKIYNKEGDPTQHALYGYDTKYTNRVSDAQFKQIINEFKGTVPHPQTWGWQWSGIRCCRDNYRLHNEISGGRTLCENETNYDNSVTNGDTNNGHWTDMWDGVSVEADVSGSKYRGNERYTDIDWPIINTASTAGTIMGTNSRSEYYGKSISQLPSGTTTEWLYFADRLGKNKKVLAKYYYQYKRVGHHYYVRYRAICENGGYVYRVTSRHITSKPGDYVSWTGYVDENKKGTNVTTEWLEIPTTNANKQSAWTATAYMYVRDTIEGPYIPERKTTNPEGYLDNYSELRYYYPLIDDKEPKTYNSNNWVIIGNGTPTHSSTLATVKVQFSDLMQFDENLVYVHIYDDDKKTIMKQFVVGQEWVPCERITTFNDGDHDFDSQVWQATLQIQTETNSYKDIYVQAKDSRGNLSELIPVRIGYIDSKGPTITVKNLNNLNTWSKSKVYDITATDASANFQIGLGIEDMKDATASTTRHYTFVGDVNLTATKRGKSFAIWGKDSAGNVSYETLDLLSKQVKYLDNTAPTLQTTVTNNHTSTTVKITADDYCSTIKEQGSGKVADGAGKYGFYYGYSRTNDAKTATWSNLETSATHTYTLEYTGDGTYYFWVKDYVGNISAVKSVKINPYWIVKYFENNPVKAKVSGDIKNVPAQQQKWAQTNLMLSTTKPTKTGYNFLYWNTKADGSGVTYKPSDYYKLNQDMNLYAQWRPIEYDIVYHSGDTSDYDWNHIDKYKQHIIYDEIPFNLELNTFSRTSNDKYEQYEFKGWSDKENSWTKKYDNSQQITKNLTTIDGTEINLYAIWEKSLTLTFNMNGGSYNGSQDDVVLSTKIYNAQHYYDFKINNEQVTEKQGYYLKQTNKIDAYGIYDNNGENSKYVKYDSNGNTYRFLGWSTNKDATEPDSDLIVFDESHKLTYRISNNTTLYAVWEPVLVATISLERTLGNLTFSNGKNPVTLAQNVRASSGTQYLELIAKPGEQCKYQVNTKGVNTKEIYTVFDSRITDIYNNIGTWTDSLNPNTNSGEELSENHGLDRRITLSNNVTTRKFYIPQYLGTKQSYKTSIGVTQYHVLIEIVQNSFYYKHMYGTVEQVEVVGTIYITGNSEEGYIPTEDEPVVSVLDELRAKLKIRLH